MKSVEELAREHFNEACAWIAKEKPDFPIEKSLTMQAYIKGHASRDPEVNELVECLREFIHEANEAYGESDLYRLVPMIDEARDLLSKFEPKKEGV